MEISLLIKKISSIFITTISRDRNKCYKLRWRKRRFSSHQKSNSKKICLKRHKGRANSFERKYKKWWFRNIQFTTINFMMAWWVSAKKKTKVQNLNHITLSSKSKGLWVVKCIIVEMYTQIKKFSLIVSGCTWWQIWRVMTWRSTEEELCLTSSFGREVVFFLLKILVKNWSYFLDCCYIIIKLSYESYMQYYHSMSSPAPQRVEEKLSFVPLR